MPQLHVIRLNITNASPYIASHYMAIPSQIDTPLNHCLTAKHNTPPWRNINTPNITIAVQNATLPLRYITLLYITNAKRSLALPLRHVTQPHRCGAPAGAAPAAAPAIHRGEEAITQRQALQGSDHRAEGRKHSARLPSGFRPCPAVQDGPHPALSQHTRRWARNT